MTMGPAREWTPSGNGNVKATGMEMGTKIKWARIIKSPRKSNEHRRRIGME
jgi:hypothetical protein